MSGALGGIHKRERADCMSFLGEFSDWIDCAERVRDMRESKQFYFRGEQRRKWAEIESSVIADANKAQPRAGSLGQQLPRYEVTVMLHFCEEDHISFTDKFSAPRLRHEIYTFRGSAREDDFISANSADIVSDTLARFFISFGRARAQLVQSAMHICVFVFVVPPKYVDHRARFLRRCGAIKID